MTRRRIVLVRSKRRRFYDGGGAHDHDDVPGAQHDHLHVTVKFPP